MKKYIKLLSVVLAGSILSSCLKDDSLVLDPENGTNVIEFANTSDIAVHGSTVPLYIHSYDISATPVTLNIPISYSGPEATAPTDITVTVALGTTADLTAYNGEQHTAYELIPTSVYTIPNLTVVIPKGQSKGMLPVQFKTNQFDLSKQLALPLKIASVSSGTISGNFGKAIYAVGAKNKYDGVYTVTGTYIRGQTAGATGIYPKTVHLITRNATDVAYFDDDYGIDGHIFKTSTGGASYYGNWDAIFQMNPDNNVVVSVTNKYGQGTNASGRLGKITPGGINKWTITSPTNKKMEVSYELHNAAGLVAGYVETYTYVGPR